MTATELKKRAIALAEKTKIDSVTPEEVGQLSNDIVEYIENVEINGSSLGIRKTYTSVSAMEADSTAPKDDKGVLLRRGMLVNIYNQEDPDSADNGKVFSFQNPGWAFRGTVDAGYATKEELTELLTKVNILDFQNVDNEQTFTTDVQIQTYEQLDKEIPAGTEVEVELLTNNTGQSVTLNLAELNNGVNRTDVNIGSEIGAKVKFNTKYKAVYGRIRTSSSSSDNTKSAVIRWIEKKSVRLENIESDIQNLNNQTETLKSNAAQNDANIKELQSKAIDEVAEALWSNNQVPTYLDESTLDDLSVGNSYANYLTPKRGVTKITDITIRFNRIPNGNVKVVALNLDLKLKVELDSFLIESEGVFSKHYDNPLVCEEGYDIWIYAPQNTSNLPCVCSYSLEEASFFSNGETLDNLYERKNTAILIIYKNQTTVSEYINAEIENVKKENNDVIEATNQWIRKNESDILLRQIDKYANKTIAYAGDSYANGANNTSTTRKGNTYPYEFSLTLIPQHYYKIFFLST